MQYLFIFSSSSTILFHWNLLSILKYHHHLAVITGDESLSCRFIKPWETNYFLTVTHLSFSISLNVSLTDFLMFIFMASTWSWQPSEIQRGATFPEDWELDADIVPHCERTWARGNNLSEKTSPAAVKHTHLERTIKRRLFITIQSKVWHPDDKHRETLMKKRAEDIKYWDRNRDQEASIK